MRLEDGNLLSGRVWRCQQIDGDEYHATIQFAAPVDKGSDRRVEARFPVCHAAELSIIGTSDTAPARITVINLSRSGLGARSPVEVPSGTAVEIALGRYRVFGVVRHCRMRGGAYHLGITITDMLDSAESSGTSSLRDQIRELARQIRLDGLEPSLRQRCRFRNSPPLPISSSADPVACPFHDVEREPAPGVEAWNCDVCRAVELWTLEGHTLLVCEEIAGGSGLYVHPADAGSSARGTCLMQIRVADLPPADLRALLQTVLTTGAQTWIGLSDRSLRIR